MNNKLITALRSAATALEQGSFHYDWTCHERCNCGVVICALKGWSANDLRRYLNRLPGDNEGRSWAEAAGFYCPITGTPTHVLFRELNNFGLTAKDIVELENLSNPEVLQKLQLIITETVPKVVTEGRFLKRLKTVYETHPKRPERSNKDHLIAYLRAWANILVENSRMDCVDGRTVKQLHAENPICFDA